MFELHRPSVGSVPRQRRALCRFVIGGCDNRSSPGAALLSTVCSRLLDPQLVSDWGTPAHSSEHEQCGHAVKGAVPFKRQRHQTETKALTSICSTLSCEDFYT